MALNNTSNTLSSSVLTPPVKTSSNPVISKIAAPLLWILFITSMGALIYYQIETPQWNWIDAFRINGFTLLIWVTVTFFSAIVSTYSKKLSQRL